MLQLALNIQKYACLLMRNEVVASTTYFLMKHESTDENNGKMVAEILAKRHNLSKMFERMDCFYPKLSII